MACAGLVGYIVSRQHHQRYIVVFGLELHISQLAISLIANALITLLHVSMIIGAVWAVGGSIGPLSAHIALTAGVGIGAIIPTPGGVGGVETVLAASLAASGVPPEQAVAASILYRLATFWQPVLPGLIAYGYLRSRRKL
jgi:uncharacterized protein (TIRG00374 family)